MAVFAITAAFMVSLTHLHSAQRSLKEYVQYQIIELGVLVDFI
jgi:hypothetical protein